MCGFIGFSCNNKELLYKLSVTLEQRAYDDQNYFNIQELSLYHAHLKVSDLDKNTQQPLHSNKKIYMLVGEIYNVDELRERNSISLTVTELELISILYEKEGEKFVESLNGEFSIFIYDTTNKKYLLFTDRYNTKPVYYSFVENTLFFSSEIKTLLLVSSIDKNILSFYLYFVLGFLPSGYTFFKDINVIRPGSVLTYISGGIVKVEAYGGYKTSSKLSCIQTLEESVKRRIPKFQNKLLVSLSGGLDSNTILYFLKKHFGGVINAVIFETNINTEDVNIAIHNCKQLGIKYFLVDMDKYDFLSHQYNDYYTHESLTKCPQYEAYTNFIHPSLKDVKVIFSGDGKEELFKLNSHFNIQKMKERLRLINNNELIDKIIQLDSEYLNSNMFDYNLQIISKLSLGEGRERRMPFVDYEMLKFVHYKDIISDMKKVLSVNGLKFLHKKQGCNAGLKFSYIPPSSMRQELKKYYYAFKKYGYKK